MGLGIGIGISPSLGAGVSAAGGGGISFVGRIAARPPTETVSDLAAFSAWLGVPADYATVFLHHSDWTTFSTGLADLTTEFAGVPVIWAGVLNVTGTTLAQAAAGDFDSYYTSAAQAILAAAPADGSPILVRAGHEFNLPDVYPWELPTSGAHANFITAFRRFVACHRAVSNRFRFVWNPNWTSATTPQYDVTLAYPGDAYVDVIGTDLYYLSATDNASPTVAFNYARDLEYGLAWQVAFAAAHGKATALCEFGTNWDRPQWIDLIYAWITDNAYAWSGYFDTDFDATYTCRLSNGNLPDSGARFKADFKNGGPIPLRNHTFFWDNDGFSGGGTAVFSRVGAVAQVTGVSNYGDKASVAWSGLTIGASYRVELDVNTGGKDARITVIQGSAPFDYTTADQTLNNAALAHLVLGTFVASQASHVLQIVPYAGDAAQVVKFDNVQLFAA